MYAYWKTALLELQHLAILVLHSNSNMILVAIQY